MKTCLSLFIKCIFKFVRLSNYLYYFMTFNFNLRGKYEKKNHDILKIFMSNCIVKKNVIKTSV
jgi:hypothetical protein